MNTPGSPDDPFANFDWSIQDSKNESLEQKLHANTANEKSNNQGPPPGTYYSNEEKDLGPGPSGRAGTLTAFIVFEWITFGLSILGCGSSFFTTAHLLTLEQGSALPIFTYISLFTSTIFIFLALIYSYLAATHIAKNQITGIKYGWIETSISWASLGVRSALLLIVVFKLTSDIPLSREQRLATFIGAGVGLVFRIAFLLAKTILLIVPKTKASIKRDFI